ncbi:MAG: hypothetical protein ACQKBY_09015 [Verrucomicrobiales bacterium]
MTQAPILERPGVRLILLICTTLLWFSSSYLFEETLKVNEFHWVYLTGALLFAGLGILLPDGTEEAWNNPTRRSALKLCALLFYALLNSLGLAQGMKESFAETLGGFTFLLIILPLLAAFLLYYLLLFLCHRINPRRLGDPAAGTVEVEAVSLPPTTPQATDEPSPDKDS